jgi:hypothetical protein
MTRQALVALGPKILVSVALVGGALLGLGALFIPGSASTYRLVLHAPERPGTIYVSAWNDGDVIASHDGSDGKTITYVRRAEEHDGCSWEGRETLTPLGPRAYLYTYDERIVSCEADAKPFDRTPRTGIVTVERTDTSEEVTALDDVQEPGDLWNPDDLDGDDAADLDELAALDADDHGCGCDHDDADVNVADDGE